jgi:hypothetical protein
MCLRWLSLLPTSRPAEGPACRAGSPCAWPRPVGELSAVALERELRRANRWTLIKAGGLDAAVAGTLDPRFVVAWELVRLLAGTAITGVALALSPTGFVASHLDG